MNQIFHAFLLTLFAGLATGSGSALALFAKRTNYKFLSFCLGFSAGVMIYVSMVEIFAEAQESLTGALGLKPGSWAAVGAFFGGMLLIALIDKLIPSYENPHEIKPPGSEPGAADAKSASAPKHKLMRVGVFTALAIAVHNFPEGMATFISALQQPSIAVPVAVAIAIHNIPEGIAVSIPIYYATGNRKRAFLSSFLSGLSEPLGALVGYLVLRPFLNDVLFGIVFAAVAGIMVFISLDELLPSAQEYGEHHLSIYGLTSGMVVMAVSLLLFL